MSEAMLPAPLLDVLADRFKALGEPARLRLLDTLRAGEKSVSELMEATGLHQANVSRHLRVLHDLGFVQRRRERAFVYYRLAGEDVFRLCDIMCERVDEQTRALRALTG